MKLFVRNSKLIIALVALTLGTSTLAKDFKLPKLKQAENPTFDLNDVSGKMTYYQYMQKTLGKKMLAEAPKAKGSNTNETILENGGGISVKLDDRNYNIHINFPRKKEGGRSYGWTSGQVGDWSDRMYLENLYAAVAQASESEMKEFYATVISMLGSCDASGISGLRYDTQRVTANFLAIYTAEQYRAIVAPGTKWDDAIFQVTLLAAFHSGQSTFMKYYVGKFSDKSREQDSGVYANGQPGPLFKNARVKEAEMNDYWQISANPSSNQSGINLSRKDFEKMGREITARESSNTNLKRIEEIVGESDNVFGALARYFALGKAKASETEELAAAVADFMTDIKAHAGKITTALIGGKTSGDDSDEVEEKPKKKKKKKTGGKDGD